MTTPPATVPARIAPCSRGPGLGKRAEYLCAFPWPDCYVQAGERGIVFTHAPTDPLADMLSAVIVAADTAPQRADRYTTAFFEAFIRRPDSFLRGEGATVAEAEARCWAVAKGVAQPAATGSRKVAQHVSQLGRNWVVTGSSLCNRSLC